MNFTDLMLSSELLQAVRDLGFEAPTPIQERVIPQLLNDETDVVALAQTGTGKTAAFGLPILQRLEEEEKSIQALVLCPTRELCLQITQDMKSYSKYMRGISITPVYGGAEMAQQIKSLRKGTHVVVATPGRLLDLIHRRVADIGAIRYLVLDEADIMLNMGFKEELDAILEAAPPDRQTVLLSATMPEDVARIASSYMRNTVEITIGRKNAGTANVEHGYVMVHAKDKYAALKRLVDFYPGMYGIIFCRTRQSTKEIAERMIGDGYNAEALHGDLSQAQREQVMRKFRDRGLQLLVATDIAARGLDVNDLTHILHFDLPDEPGIYTHRSGRTGRAGKTGISLVLINMKERYRIRQIEKVLQRSISEARVPLGKEICEKQLMGLIERIKTIDVDTPQIEPFMSMIEEELSALDREQLIKHFVSLEFNRFLQYYKNLPDLAPVTALREPKQNRSTKKFLRGKGTGEGDKTGFSTITLNLGKKDRVLPPQIIGLVNQCTRNRKIRLGRIDIGFTSSRVQIDSYHADRVSEALCGCRFRGRTLIAERRDTKQGKARKTA